MGKFLSIAALLAAALPAPAAQAAVLDFTGTANATAFTSLDASCAPKPFRGLANGTGTSTLGTMSYFHNACTEGAKVPVSLAEGIFAITFGSGAINGRFAGTSTPRAGVPGLFDQDFLYTILGGSGGFLGASGSFRNLGTVDVRGGPPSRLSLNFAGLINAPSIPEPSSWALLLAGFFAIGIGMRARAGALSQGSSLRQIRPRRGRSSRARLGRYTRIGIRT